jgi:hypothetical protein
MRDTSMGEWVDISASPFLHFSGPSQTAASGIPVVPLRESSGLPNDSPYRDRDSIKQGGQHDN